MHEKNNGADIRFIQQMLRHVSIGTTEIYTHVSIVKLKQVYEMTRPTWQGRQKLNELLEATEEALMSTLADEAEDDD